MKDDTEILREQIRKLDLDKLHEDMLSGIKQAMLRATIEGLDWGRNMFLEIKDREGRVWKLRKVIEPYLDNPYTKYAFLHGDFLCVVTAWRDDEEDAEMVSCSLKVLEY